MNTVKCPKCGNENLCTNIRCESCGTQLITEEQSQDIYLDPNIQSDPVKLDSFIQIFSGIGTTIGGAIFGGFSFMFIFKGTDNITKIIGIPFLICGLAILIYGILSIFKGINIKRNTNNYINNKLNRDKVEKSEKVLEKVEYFFNHIYIFGFLLFYFSFLIVFDTIAIKSWADGGNSMFFFSLIFWLIGIYVLTKNIKKK